MVCELIRNLDFDRFDVSLYYFQQGSSDSFLNIVSNTPAHIRFEGPFVHLGFTQLYSISRTLTKDNPDIVHAHLGGIQASLPWSLLHSKKTVVTLHSTLPAALNSSASKLVHFAGEKRVQLVAVSNQNQCQAREYFGSAFSNLVSINNGVTLSDFSQCDLTADPCFINVAAQNDNKNQALIIKAFVKLQQQVPNARLILVGDGPNHKKLKDMALGNQAISIDGASSRIPELLSRANVYVQSSNREGMPLSILEALASGMPVISTNVGGIKDVVSPSCSVLIGAQRDDQLFDAMLKLCDRSTRVEMGKASKARSKLFSASVMAAKYEELYLRMCSCAQ